MNRTLVTLSVAATFAAAVSAQCFNPTGGASISGTLVNHTGGDPVHDEGRSPLTAMGLAFPMPGAGTFTDCVIESNGVIYLTNGTAPVTPANYTYGSLGTLSGPVGSGPRIAPFWRDLWAMPAGWDITTESVPGVSFKVTWTNTADYFTTVAPKSFSATLFAIGVVEFSYDNLAITSTFVGLSVGNGVGATQPASDFASSPTGGTTGLIYENFSSSSAWDLGSRTISFTPNGLGGWDVATVCAAIPASHTAYGAGCYDIPAGGFYELHADAAAGSAALQGNAMRLDLAGGSYLATWLPAGAGAYVAPTAGATSLPTTDDSGQTIVLPAALPTPAGPATQLHVNHNGVLSLTSAVAGNHDGDWTPSGVDFANAALAAFYSWHDFNDTETGSGAVKTEQIGNVFYVTWDGVESYPAGANPSTLQFQLDLSSGSVTYVWVAIDTNTTSTFGSGYLVGYKGIGVITDPGSSVLPTALPALHSHVQMVPMALAATPAPISTPSSGTLVTYTQSNIPEAAPGSGLHIGLTILSLGQDLAGTDLGFLGMPGCSLHVASLDLTFAFVGATSSLTTQFQIPAGVPGGFQLYAQSAALIQAGSLPNGQNAFGATVSNGVASYISSF